MFSKIGIKSFKFCWRLGIFVEEINCSWIQMNCRRNNEQNFLLLNPFEHTVSLYDIPGLLIAVRKDYFRVISHRELLFNDCGDRVAQLLHVELAAPCSPCRNNDTRQEILIVNTHLLFPHDSSLSLVRLNQASTFSSFLKKKKKLIFFTSNF